jgi:hypothetical protein
MSGKKNTPLIVSLVASLVLLACPGHASFLNDFKDPKDGGLDTSKMLMSRTGFLPVPIIITEPT